MIKYSLFISEAAEKDLDEITDYIAYELREPETALNQISRIQEVILSLSEMPERHAIVQDNYLTSKGIRIVPVDNYLVFYTVNMQESAVHIVRVLYGRRDWQDIL